MAQREPRIQSIKGKKISFGRGSPIFQNFERRERGREEKKNQKNQNLSLQSTKFRQSEFIRPRTKVHLLNEGYVWAPKTRGFAKDSSEEFGKSKVSGLGSVHGTS